MRFLNSQTLDIYPLCYEALRCDALRSLVRELGLLANQMPVLKEPVLCYSPKKYPKSLGRGDCRTDGLQQQSKAKSYLRHQENAYVTIYVIKKWMSAFDYLGSPKNRIVLILLLLWLVFRAGR